MAIYIGGTTGNNQFDDYEEGAWTPVLQAYDHSSAPGGWSNVTFDELRRVFEDQIWCHLSLNLSSDILFINF